MRNRSRFQWIRYASLVLLGVAFLSPALLSQDAAASKQKFKERLKALKTTDWDGMADLAAWGMENGLTSEPTDLLKKIVKAQPNHEKARKLLGFERHNGEWMLASEAEKLKAKEREEDYKNRGYIQFKGEWVPASFVPFLKKGLVMYGDQWISQEDRKKIDAGWEMLDGEMIPPAEADNVRQGKYKVGGLWMTLEEADEYHKSFETPWAIPTTHFILYTNLDRKTAEEQKPIIEQTYERLYEIFEIPITEKPPIFVFATNKEYSEYMAQFGGHHSSVWPGSIPERDERKPGVSIYEKSFGSFYLSHAVAHLYLDRATEGAPVPEWLAEGITNYASRFHTPELRKWSVDNLTRRGDIDPVTMFTERFELSADAVEMSQKNLLQVGALVSYFMESGDEKAKKMFLETLQILPSGKERKISKAVDKLVRADKDLTKKLREYCKKVGS